MITDVTTKYKKIFRNQVGKLILFSIFLFFFFSLYFYGSVYIWRILLPHEDMHPFAVTICTEDCAKG